MNVSKGTTKNKFQEIYAFLTSNLRRAVFTGAGLVLVIGWLLSRINYLNPYPLPASLLYTDLSPTTAVVTFLSADPFRGCVFYQRRNALFGRFSCESQGTMTHRVSLQNLLPGQAYTIRVGYGIKWWSLYRAETKPNFDVMSGSVPITSIPYLATPAMAIPDDYPKVTMKGVVVDSEGNAEPKALVVFAHQPNLILYSAKTGDDGGFEVTILNAEANNQLTVNAWTATASASFVESAERFNNEKKPIIVEPYR